MNGYHLVYSVDHGHFFPKGPNWNVENLSEALPPEPYQEFITASTVTQEELRDTKPALDAITNLDIASVVAMPHESWNFTMSERIAVAKYLSQRKEELLSFLPKVK